MHKSVPKVPKVLTFGKVSQKIPKNPKILGGGGSDLFWTKSKLKLHFFFEKLPNFNINLQKKSDQKSKYYITVRIGSQS